MADVKHRMDIGSERGESLERRSREPRGLQRSDPWLSGPADWFDRLSTEMERTYDRMFREFGFPRRSWLARGGFEPMRQGLWSPRIETFQKGDAFIVRAELPGLKKDEVHVEIDENTLTLRGERREERQEEHEGYYHSEREYGEFHRTIPLPDGVIGDSAKASFRDGILEIRMQSAPSETRHRRKVEITDGAEAERKK